GDAMGNLKKLGLDVTLKKLNSEKRHIFGVCLGLQLFMEYSEEDGGYECLNLLPGTVKKLPPGNKIPHMGWNQVNQVFVHPIFHGIPDGTNFYFVHSYYADVKDKHIVAGVTDYGISFPSIVVRDNLVATQFHPEKSGDLGLMMYKNFLEMYIKK
ncbi:MAG: imidazole glycerol phosphate synthase subunit HisH, partial [Dehalococcoidia bacterium]|nr:imidazole glycerol phosphate synthase subunit HisH [Dehalococcoidia bacterium]